MWSVRFAVCCCGPLHREAHSLPGSCEVKLWKFPGFFPHPTSILQFDGVIHVWGISDIVTVEDPLDDLVPDFWIDFFPHLGDDELESIPIIVEDFFVGLCLVATFFWCSLGKDPAFWTFPCCQDLFWNHFLQLQ